MRSDLVVGLFVGGRGSRWGGIAKGNLRLASGTRLIERLIEVCREALPGAPLVLVGRAADYADLGLATLDDQPSGIGPLGGLRALVAHASNTGREGAVALACDMPHVSARLVARLGTEAPGALALAPCVRGLWEPLSARYSKRALPALEAAVEANERSLQRFFVRLGGDAVSLPLASTELRELTDWDCPEDVVS